MGDLQNDKDGKDEHETARRDRAYAIWEREGRPEGRHAEHWDEAGAGGQADSTTPTPAGTQGERDARGGGDKPIPAAAPKNPNADA